MVGARYGAYAWYRKHKGMTMSETQEADPAKTR